MKVVECDFLKEGYTVKLGDILIVGTKATEGIVILNEQAKIHTTT